MRNLVIMPTENKERMNLGEFAEEATIIEETATPKRVNHFIEANTQEATLQHLKNDCITPVFAKDNELTVNMLHLLKQFGKLQTPTTMVRLLERPIFVSLMLLRVARLMQSISQPISYWNLTKLSIMKGQLSALTFLQSMKRSGETS